MAAETDSQGSPSEKVSPSSSGRAAPTENAIAASRKPRRAQRRAQPQAAAEAPSAAPAAPAFAASAWPGTTQRTDTDPWTVPQSVRDRFVQEGNRFYFPDGVEAFRDRGRRLTTTSENTEVVRSLIEIARSRGWTEVTVSGADDFKRLAWSQSRLAGLAVRGYRPTDAERSELVQAMGRRVARATDSISEDQEPVALTPTQAGRETRPAEEHYAGRLLDHGKDTYRHEPDAEPSYFVRLGIPGGYREIWGKDLERAVTRSLTQPQPGDDVVLQRAGRDAVIVKRPERNSDGEVSLREVETYRNRWVLEKREFFERRAEAARTVRDETLGAREAVQRHPELAGTYLNLRAAELAAQRLRDPRDQQRFVLLVRAALADGIERGEPLQPVRLRDRVASRSRVPRGLDRTV